MGTCDARGNVPIGRVMCQCPSGTLQLMGKFKKPTHYIAEWREHRGLTQQELADAAHIGRPAISKIESGERPLMQDRQEAFAKALKVTVPQLFTPPPNGDSPTPDIQGERLRPSHKRIAVDSKPPGDVEFPEGLSPITEVDMRAGMGGGGFIEAEETTEGNYQISKDVARATWGVPDEYLRELGVRADGTFLFRVVGDSMTKPDGSGLHSGDLVMANTKDNRPSPPGIFAIFDGMGTVVKRLEFVMNSDPPAVNVISDNPIHAPMKFAADEVAIIGRCVWYGRPL